MKLLARPALLCVVCYVTSCVGQWSNEKLTIEVIELKLKVRTDSVDVKESIRMTKTDLEVLINGLTDRLSKRIDDLENTVAANKKMCASQVAGQSSRFSQGMNRLKKTVNSSKNNFNNQLIKTKARANNEKEQNKLAIQAIRDSIVKSNNQTKTSVKALWNNLNKFKENTYERLEDIRDSVNNNRNLTRFIAENIKDDMNNNRKEAKRLVVNVSNKLRDYKDVMKIEIREIVDSVKATETLIKSEVDEIQKENSKYRETIQHLARHTMLLQFGVEERVRSDGDSGIKLSRGMSKGPDNYYETGLFGPAVNMIHDHSDYERTIGMGEVITVLNGVEFKTRHNDYKLKMASTTSTDFHATEDIPFPEVPPQVTGSVDEQITEMREWFKAFATQNATHRNYPEYFKPVLCYLEGTWTLDTKNLDEPFDSDRHQIDATSWFDLQEKVRFSSYTGTKSRLENFANLPTTIMSVNETTGQPQYAQWNYRILCAPLKEDLPTKELRQMDDLAFRIPRKRSTADVSLSRGARFRLYAEDTDKFTRYSKLDRLFYNIPGKDNTPGELRQESFGETLIDMGSATGAALNTGFYHRFFKFSHPGAMGIKDVSRGYNDANMWVAQNTQERVAPFALKNCLFKKRQQNCTLINTRFSYAIPLEIIYMTPLLSWNPYDLETGKEKKDVRADGRNGILETDRAYNGTGPVKQFYMTPSEFFNGRVDKSDPADTVRNAVGVLDKQGVMRKVTASGTKIIMQPIEGIEGRIRLRYPISPIHGEGSAVWKELNALKYLVKAMAATGKTLNTNIIMMMSTTTQDPPGEHTHEISLDLNKFLRMYEHGEQIEVTSSRSHNHKHTLKLRYLDTEDRFDYRRCDGELTCWDGHGKEVTLVTNIVKLLSDMVGNMNGDMMRDMTGNMDMMNANNNMMI